MWPFHPVEDPFHANACRPVFRRETSSSLSTPVSSPGESTSTNTRSCTTRSPHGTVWSTSGVGTGSDVSKISQNPKVEFVPVFCGSLPAAERIRASIKAQQYHRETLNQNNQYRFNLPWYSKHISVIWTRRALNSYEVPAISKPDLLYF